MKFSETLAKDFGYTKLSENIAAEISSKLDFAAKLDDVQTITFGLETDDGQIVKVFVNEKDADKFQTLIANMLGASDSIEDVINKVATDVDIVDVEWPKADEPEAPLEGSEVLDPDVYSDANLNKEIKTGLAESNEQVGSISNRFTTNNQQLVFQAIIDLGIPEQALNRSAFRNSIINGIKETADLLQHNPALKTVLKNFVKKRIDVEDKIEKEPKTENLKENVSTDLFWNTLKQLIQLTDKSVGNKAANAFFDSQKFELLIDKSEQTLRRKLSGTIKRKLNMLVAALNHAPKLEEAIDFEDNNKFNVANALEQLLKFAEPDNVNLVGTLLSSSAGKQLYNRLLQGSVTLNSQVKKTVEQLVDAINTTVSLEEESLVKEFGYDELMEAKEKLSSGKLVILESITGTKFSFSPRLDKVQIREIGNSSNVREINK